MAVRWDGFSDEDIKKLKSKGNDAADTTREATPVEPSPLVIQKRATLSVAARRSCDRASAASVAAAAPAQQNIYPDEDVSEVRFSYSTPTSKSEMKGSTESSAAAILDGATQESFLNGNGEAIHRNPLLPSGPFPFTLSRPRSARSLISALTATARTAPAPLVIDIDDFESRQKMMEEQNRLRKVFLSKALKDRKKQASAEAKRLNMIQEELQKLDQRLSGDVCIIRNQIESASIEFLEAQKRYDRAEKEFLEAKMLFFTKLERKELLTHHLCTIIEQNEMRKAQKLSELMEKLDMRAELNSEQDCEKSSAEVTLTPDEAGGSGDALPDPVIASSNMADAEEPAETDK